MMMTVIIDKREESGRRTSGMARKCDMIYHIGQVEQTESRTREVYQLAISIRTPNPFFIIHVAADLYFLSNFP